MSGVPYVAIETVANYVRGVTYSKNDEQADGPIRVLRANNITLATNTVNFEDVRRVAARVKVRDDQRLVPNDILIAVASGSKAHIGKVAFIPKELPFTFGGFMAVLRLTSDALLPRFLFHYLTGRTFSTYLEDSLSSTTINNLSSTVMRQFRVPVPPISAQREVVRILDQFTGLEAELETQLEAELETRRRQYAHHREALIVRAHDFPNVSMSDLGEFIRGRRFTKNDYVPEGVPSIHYGEIYTTYGTATSSTKTHVRREIADQLRFAQPGDVIIAAVGETVEDVAKSVAWLGDEPVAIHDDTFLFRSSLNPKYVAYAMQTYSFSEQKNKFVSRAKVKRMSSDGIGRIAIPVPPRDEQDQIVDILDNFDSNVAHLSEELAAEQRGRRKQYEYYRNRLLTFQEVTA